MRDELYVWCFNMAAELVFTIVQPARWRFKSAQEIMSYCFQYHRQHTYTIEFSTIKHASVFIYVVSNYFTIYFLPREWKNKCNWWYFSVAIWIGTCVYILVTNRSNVTHAQCRSTQNISCKTTSECTPGRGHSHVRYIYYIIYFTDGRPATPYGDTYRGQTIQLWILQ